MDWITDIFPEENRIILIYDMLEGLNLGYYSALSREFYTFGDMLLRDVCAWMYVPNKPKSLKRIQDTVRVNSFLSASTKKETGGTKDV